MALVGDRCICLRNVEYSETSQILTLLGREQGLVRVIAKGAHRVTKAGASRFGGGIDLLDEGDAVFTDRPEKDLAILTEWRLREGHLPLRRSLRAVHLAFYAAELVSVLIEERDPHPELYDSLTQVLAELATDRREQAFIAFELDLLRQTGYLPQLDACASCGRKIGERESAYFAPMQAGIVCRNCEGAFPDRLAIDGRLLGIMRYLLNMSREKLSPNRLPALTRHQSDPINRLLAEHVEHTLGRRLKLPKYILRDVG